VHFKAGLRGEILEAGEAGERLVKLTADGSLPEALAKAGELALPPYIRETQADESRYQTVYAAKPGSVAAPTAGLHFTQELLDQLTDARVNMTRLSLDIGLDTFRPMAVAALDDHQMHTEEYSIGEAASQQLLQARESGGRLLAVGTTTVRALESWAVSAAVGQPGSFRTDLFIRPGFDFQLTDMMLTNFHLPRSTLLVMVSAFAGLPLIKQAYQAAVEAEYRFYSFGDAMLIL
jgi:S-adenosylmethionine:tRNA ribosyltransferase-isomerase